MSGMCDACHAHSCNAVFHLEKAMNCPRCQGTMVTDYFLDMEDSGEVWMSAWRCLSCGEVLDPLILKHREAQQAQYELVGAISKRPANKTQAPVSILSRKS